MFTDWLIYLDYLEENNCNTSFLRLITSIIFGVIESHEISYNNGCGRGNNVIIGDGSGDGDVFGDGMGNGFGDGIGNGIRNIYPDCFDEDH